jgi:hypothetical protein
MFGNGNLTGGGDAHGLGFGWGDGFGGGCSHTGHGYFLTVLLF